LHPAESTPYMATRMVRRWIPLVRVACDLFGTHPLASKAERVGCVGCHGGCWTRSISVLGTLVEVPEDLLYSRLVTIMNKDL
jgi:hypothetical protein